jgi:hypothetical protein
MVGHFIPILAPALTYLFVIGFIPILAFLLTSNLGCFACNRNIQGILSLC